MIMLESDESYEFHCCGIKKRRKAGVGFLIQVDPITVVNETNVSDFQTTAINLKNHGFNIRLVNVYSPTETDSSKSKRDLIYRLLDKVCQKQEKHEQIIVIGDFNAKASLTFESCY